ncbi:hypothetical protein GP486_002549 [Trichoglossum hirsutum]|uniref:Uncharacterized protein n=1 Tax=Trichoglossum hirsutum TaxID=265104 RepID=A0A9P8LEJ7_9PEZI|nr:hypothetical protein GP486_002549 [Trichoglossum hirsutum]
MQGLTNAALTLQQTGFCCNQFAVLAACEQSLDPSGKIPVVLMNTIPFNSLMRLANEIAALERDGISASADPLSGVTLCGSLANQSSIVVQRRELACMGDMIGDEIFVFGMNYSSQTLLDSNIRLYLSAACEEIVDSWGPGYFITDIDAPYGKMLYGLWIRGGIIKLDPGLTSGERLFHWDPEFNNSTSQSKTFSY